MENVKTCLGLSAALLIAIIIPAPRHDINSGEPFSVVGSDFMTPLISSPRGIQTLNARLNDYARFAGYDQIHTFVCAGSTRELATITRYSGDIFSLLGASFVMRAAPGTIDRPIYISAGFWQRVLGGTPDILGQVLEAAGEVFQVAGVLRGDMILLKDTEVWLPLSAHGPYSELTALRVIGRSQAGSNWRAGEESVTRAVKTDRLQEQVFDVGAVHWLPMDEGLNISAPDVFTASNDQ